MVIRLFTLYQSVACSIVVIWFHGDTQTECKRRGTIAVNSKKDAKNGMKIRYEITAEIAWVLERTSALASTRANKDKAVAENLDRTQMQLRDGVYNQDPTEL